MSKPALAFDDRRTDCRLGATKWTAVSEKTPAVSIVMFLGAAILGALGAYL
jgi:hypothetical protein